MRPSFRRRWCKRLAGKLYAPLLVYVQMSVSWSRYADIQVSSSEALCGRALLMTSRTLFGIHSQIYLAGSNSTSPIFISGCTRESIQMTDLPRPAAGRPISIIRSFRAFPIQEHGVLILSVARRQSLRQNFLSNLICVHLPFHH